MADETYALPAVEGLLRSDGVETRGGLADILAVYEQLSESARHRSVIMLDKPIAMPRGFARTTALNLFDGEATFLLPYLHG